MDTDQPPSITGLRSLHIAAVAVALSVVLALISGCGTGRRHISTTTETTPLTFDKRVAEAYLFDTEIEYRDKYSSVRLELYAADSIVGVAGRSYLGKGALDGWLTRDSVLILFPSSGEYVEEAVPDLIGAIECTNGTVAQIDLLTLLYEQPSRSNVGTGISITPDSANQDRPCYSLSMPGCLWRIDLCYDRREIGWRIREFSYTNGDNLSISARRREYKAEVTAGPDKFAVTIPPDALRISP
ncbi:MAG: hypothetical protein RBT76_14480 [candidate division Zixibacteria bacterium]|jgi:hypothetical protein|nr:hypothetical protein [candidate division Zixibacteria bacterium]